MVQGALGELAADETHEDPEAPKKTPKRTW